MLIESSTNRNTGYFSMQIRARVMLYTRQPPTPGSDR